MKISTKTQMGRAVGLGLLFVSAVTTAVVGYGSAKVKAAPAKAVGAKVAANLAGAYAASSRFIENKGQWDSRAKFLGRGNGIDTWVTDSSVLFDAYQMRMAKKKAMPYEKRFERTQVYRKGQVVKMNFVGGQPATSVEGAGELNGRTNYFLGRVNATNVRGYQESVMRNVYPGIDSRLYFQSEKPRYDLIVRPGADPSQIKLQFEGADGVRLNGKTELRLQTGMGTLSVSGLYAYQNIRGRKVQVPAAFQLGAGGTVTFALGKYDPSQPLVIDPVVFSSLLGGVGSVDLGNAVAVDRFNKPYVVGSATAATFPTTIGAYDEELVGIDAFVSKFSADGTELEYSTYIGGGELSDRYDPPYDDFEDPLNPLTPEDSAFDVEVDFDGNAYIVGYTASSDFDVSIGAYNEPPHNPENFGVGRTKQDFYDGFVVKVNPTGNALVWSRYLGGERFDIAKSVALGADGSIYVLGDTQSETSFPLVNPLQGAIQGDGDAFLTKLTSDGTTVTYSTYLGGTDLILPDDGFFPDPPTPPGTMPDDPMNPYDNSHTHGDDDVGLGVEVDSDGFAYVLIRTTFNDAPKLAGSYDTVVNGMDALVLKINQDGGSLSYGTFIGGNDTDFPTAMALDGTGNVYITGATLSFNYPLTVGVLDSSYNLGIDCFVTKLNRLGTGLVYSTFLNTVNGCQPLAIKVDDLGFAHMTGLSAQSVANATWLPVTPNADDPTFNGPADPFLSVGDLFLMVLNDTGTGVQYCSYWGGSQPDLGVGIDLDTSRNAYLTGYTQSDAPSTIPFPTTPGAFKTDLVRDALGVALPDAYITKIKTRIPITIQSLDVTPGDLPGGDSATGTVTLSGPATQGGTLVSITNTNGSIVSHPNEIVIPAGQTTGTFTIDTVPNIVTVQVVKITATAEGDFKSDSLTIKPWLEGFTLSNTSVVGGNPMAARVTLSYPARTGGMTVQLSSTNTAVATVPTTVTVPEGETTAVFDVTTLGVAVMTTVEINASLNGLTITQPLDVLPAKLVELSFNPVRVSGGTASTGKVRLDGKAPDAGVTVTLSSNDPAVTVPPTVVISGQSQESTFTADTAVVAINTTAIITANLGAETVLAQLDVLVANLVTLTVTPNSVLGGNSATGTVSLDQPAATGGVTISLSSSDPLVASLPATVVIPSGATFANFTITTTLQAVTTNVTISADRDGVGAIPALTANLEVRQVAYNISINPSQVPGGLSAIGTLTLDEAAPTGGITIALSSDNPAASVPDTVTIDEGEDTVTFPVSTIPVSSDTTVTITGTFLSSTASDTLLVQAAVPVDLDINPSSVKGGDSAVGTVRISGIAPAGGVVVTLSSDNPAASVTGSVTVLEGDDSADFNIATSGVLVDTVATITATVGATSVNATITVTATKLLEIRFIPSRVRGGTNTSMRITLDSVAPAGGAVVNIFSSDPSIATIPPSVTVDAGTSVKIVTIPTRRVSRVKATQVTANFGTDLKFAVLTVTR